MSGGYPDHRECCAGSVTRPSSRTRGSVALSAIVLAEGWSPEQIAGWLKAANEPGLRDVCTETIYAFLYRARQKAEELGVI